MSVAIFGLGLIGAEWAKHKKSDGALVATWNRSPKKDFPNFTSDPLTAAQSAEILHICVSDPTAVFGVLEAIAPALNSKHLVIQSSTIDPDSSERFSSFVKDKGACYLEAPFTGSLPAAKNRETIFYLGGDSEVQNRAYPYLESLSKKIISIGSARQAATLKLAMNLQISSAMQAMAEALSLCRQSGVGDETFFEAFKVNASYSGVASLKEEKLKSSNFDPQFSVKHMAKDMRLLFATNKSVQTPFLKQLQEIFTAAEASGLSEQDFSSIIKLCR